MSIRELLDEMERLSSFFGDSDADAAYTARYRWHRTRYKLSESLLANADRLLRIEEAAREASRLRDVYLEGFASDEAEESWTEAAVAADDALRAALAEKEVTT